MTDQEAIEAVENAQKASARSRWLGIVVAVALSIVAYSTYARFTETNARREAQRKVNARQVAFAKQQALFNRRLAALALSNCQDIENLKKANRDRAIESFRNLDTNLRLLHLTRTAPIVEAARQSRDKALVRFRPAPCPRRDQ